MVKFTQLILFCALGTCCLSAVGQQSTATPPKVASLPSDIDKVRPTKQVPTADTERIAFLIEQLDSHNYLARESAATELTEIGGLAIGPLAFQSLHCSPEQSWRIKKTLEKICTNGNEDVFFKAFGILQLRFDGGNVAMSQKMIELQTQWKLKRKQEAIASLRDNGVEVIDPTENLPQAQNIRLGGLGGNAIFLNGRPIEYFDQPVATQTRTKPKSKLLSDSELKSRMDEILNSDLDKTRELVLSAADSSSANAAAASPPDARVIANQPVFIRPGFPRSYQGIAINLSEKWTGDESDLEALTAVTNLTEIAIRNVELSPDAIDSIASLPTLTKLIFDGAQLRPDDLDGSEWSASVREIEFANREITTEIIERCASINSLQKLTFDRCEMQDAVLDDLKILEGLKGLEFKKTDISKSIFGAIAGLKQLSSVNLSACKFKTTDFEQLKTRRPQIQISFSAQAFLGVRGPVEMIQFADPQARNSAGCLISEVIPGSGADEAGLLVGDVIESVNRQPIVKFEDLRLHIAQHLPGDKLNVIVKRANKTVKLVVELGDVKSVSNN